MVEAKLTGKQQAFADYYVGEARFHGTKAAVMAGYSEKTAYSIASENLRKPEIQRYIDARLQELTLGANEVLARLTDIANGSIEDVLDDDGKFDFALAKKAGKLPLVKKLKRKTTAKKVDAITEGEEEPETLETSIVYEEVEFEMYSSHEALRDLGKFHKLFTERQEVSGSVSHYAMSKEEWEKEAAAKLQAVEKRSKKFSE
jgi:hypothetical protein